MVSLKETYNRIAQDWSQDHHADTWWIAGTDQFASLLPPGAHVLDAGCGTGVKSKYLLDKGLSVVGIDFSEKMIEIAQQDVPSIPFHVMDITDLGNLQETFDGILAQAVLLHIPKAQVTAVIHQLTSKLNAGGYLYLAVKEKRPDQAEEAVLLEDDYGYRYERFFSYFTLPEIKQHLATAVMEVCYEQVAGTGKTRWIQVVARKEQKSVLPLAHNVLLNLDTHGST